MASSAAPAGSLPPSSLQQPQPQQAAAIRRRDTRWGCSRCPGQHFARKSQPVGARSFSSLEKHVTARHLGTNWNAVAFKWGHRLQYTDGSVYDRPLPGSAPSTMTAYGPRRSRNVAAVPVSVPAQLIANFPVANSFLNLPNSTTASTVLPSVVNSSSTTPPTNNENNAVAYQTGSNTQDQSSLSNILHSSFHRSRSSHHQIANTATVTVTNNVSTNTTSATQYGTMNTSTSGFLSQDTTSSPVDIATSDSQATSATANTQDTFDTAALNNQHGTILYYLADQAFNSIYVNGQPGTLRSSEEQETAMRVYQDEKRTYLGMMQIARYLEGS